MRSAAKKKKKKKKKTNFCSGIGNRVLPFRKCMRGFLNGFFFFFFFFFCDFCCVLSLLCFVLGDSGGGRIDVRKKKGGNKMCYVDAGKKGGRRLTVHSTS